MVRLGEGKVLSKWHGGFHNGALQRLGCALVFDCKQLQRFELAAGARVLVVLEAAAEEMTPVWQSCKIEQGQTTCLCMRVAEKETEFLATPSLLKGGHVRLDTGCPAAFPCPTTF